MKLSKKIIVVLLLCLTSVANAAGIQLLKALADTLWVNEKLIADISSPISRMTVRNNIKISLRNFVKADGQILDIKTIESLRSLVLDQEDLVKFDKMVQVLKKNSDEVSGEELVELGNNMAFISQRYGFRKLGVLSCGKCVDGRIVKDKVVYKLADIQNDGLKKIYDRVLSKRDTPKAMRTYIKSSLRSQKLGNLTGIANYEEEALAVFLSVKRYGDSTQKALYDKITKLSKTKAGAVDLFDDRNNHKLWKIIPEITSPSEARLWDDLLEETGEIMAKDGDGTMDALYKVLQKRVDETADKGAKEELQNMLDYIRNNKCFARK